MKQWGKPLISLVVVIAISIALLFGMNAITRSVIEKQEIQTVQKAFEGILSGDKFEKIKVDGEEGVASAYRVLNDKGELLGFAVTTIEKGYGGDIEVFTALSPDNSRFLGLRVGTHQETPGYGARITEAAFTDQFNSLSAPASLGGGGQETNPTQPPSEQTGLKDGTYRAEQAAYSQGYKNFVEIIVEKGKIVSVNWDAFKEGTDVTKKQESKNGTYIMTESNPKWHEQAKTMEDALIEHQTPSKLIYNKETGKTDAYSGVSIDVGVFVQLAEQAIEQAQSGSTTTSLWQNGTYRAEAETYDQGYKNFVEITVTNGRISAVNWDALKEGSSATKKQESKNGTYIMTESNPKWHEQAKTMEDALIKLQNPEKIIFNADTGKTDAYAGVSIDIGLFVRLSSKALESAKIGNTQTTAVRNAATGNGAIDAISGATVSSKAVVKAANRAHEFVNKHK